MRRSPAPPMIPGPSAPALPHFQPQTPSAPRPTVASHCQPRRLEEDGTLAVVADSAAWATQLSYLQGTLLERLATIVDPLHSSSAAPRPVRPGAAPAFHPRRPVTGPPARAAHRPARTTRPGGPPAKAGLRPRYRFVRPLRAFTAAATTRCASSPRMPRPMCQLFLNATHLCVQRIHTARPRQFSSPTASDGRQRPARDPRPGPRESPVRTRTCLTTPAPTIVARRSSSVPWRYESCVAQAAESATTANVPSSSSRRGWQWLATVGPGAPDRSLHRLVWGPGSSRCPPPREDRPADLGRPPCAHEGASLAILPGFT